MKRLMVLLAALALLLAAAPALAQPGGYDLTWSIVGSGATDSTGGTYDLAGTIGRPDGGAQSGGSYDLTGGFRGLYGSVLEGTTLPYRVYLPLIANNWGGW